MTDLIQSLSIIALAIAQIITTRHLMRSVNREQP